MAEQIQDETAAPALSGDLQQLGAEPREVPLGVCQMTRQYNPNMSITFKQGPCDTGKIAFVHPKDQYCQDEIICQPV